MKKSILDLTPVALISIASLVAGCTGGRSVEVTGEVKAAASVTLTGPISIAFFDVPAEGEDAAAEPLEEIELAEPGQFNETVDGVEGDRIRIFALDDADDDGACDEGEAWASVEADVDEDGAVKAVSLVLTPAACPAAPAAAE
ncbi:MAG: hypothetical protein IT372_12775 [Polyangiaceae bacterium]|nr:hypothetical protein [Polyangiaceae bacterium]